MAVDIKHYIGAFNDRYAGGFAGTWAADVANIYTGLTSLSTIIPGVDAVPQFQVWDGTRQKVEPDNFELTLTSVHYEDSVTFPKKNYELDTIGLYDNKILELADKARFQWNKMIVTGIEENGLCSDGQNLFDTDHPYINDAQSGGRSYQSNKITASDVSALNVSTVASPTDVEMSAIVIGLFGYLCTLKDSSGDVVNGDMRSVDLIVGTIGQYIAAMKVVSGINVLSNQTENPVKGLLSTGVSIKPVLELSLTGGTDIYMVRTDGAVKAFILGETALDIVTLGPESEYAKENVAVLFGIDVYRGFVPGRYQSAVEATLS